MKVHMKEQFC